MNARTEKAHLPARATLLALAIIIAGVLAAGVCQAAVAGDPSGAATGTAADIVGVTAGAPSVADMQAAAAHEPAAAKIADVVGQNRIAINMVWLLVAGFLVMFMQAGFAMVETGFTQAKNAAHTMMMNFLVYPIGMTGFWICGFAFMFGSVGAVANLGGTAPLQNAPLSLHIFGHSVNLLGTTGFFLGGKMYDVGVYALFLFQMVFMDTAVTIPTGAMAERWKTSSFLVYGFFMSMVLYPVSGNWAWGGGWLAGLGVNLGLGNGYVDFAGSGVVHSVGGLCGLAGAIVLGPRRGKYRRDGSVRPIMGHHIPMAIIGTIILAFGWFGFNAGSTMGASGANNMRLAIVATVTMLASAGGAISAMVYMIMKTGKPDPTMVANGMLAGMVGVTGASGFVSAPAGFLIGTIAGLLACLSVAFLDKIHVDDPVGAVSVHGVGGLWGVIAVGLFADGSYGAGWNGVTGRTVTGLFHGGGFGQLGAQLIGAATLVLWAFGLSYLFFRAQDALMGLRVSPEVETGGLDLPELGLRAYPGFDIQPEGSRD